MDNKDIKYNKGLVVFLDRLGTKGKYNIDELRAFVEEYADLKEGLSSHIDQFMKIHQSAGESSGVSFKTKLTTLSDTFIITSEPVFTDEEMDGCLMYNLHIASLESLVCKILFEGLTRNWLFRGVIAYGEYYNNGGILLGPAIDEAAQWYEKADWIGCHLTPSASLIVESLCTPTPFVHFHVKYPVPFKDSGLKFNYLYALDFINWSDFSGSLSNSDINTLPKFRQALVDLFCKQPTHPDIFRKIDNTLLFFDTMAQRIMDKQTHENKDV